MYGHFVKQQRSQPQRFCGQWGYLKAHPSGAQADASSRSWARDSDSYATSSGATGGEHETRKPVIAHSSVHHHALHGPHAMPQVWTTFELPEAQSPTDDGSVVEEWPKDLNESCVPCFLGTSRLPCDPGSYPGGIQVPSAGQRSQDDGGSEATGSQDRGSASSNTAVLRQQLEI